MYFLISLEYGMFPIVFFLLYFSSLFIKENLAIINTGKFWQF